MLSCGGTQKTTNHLQPRNYTSAFSTAITQLNKDKTEKL